jgi:hypothetical protein
MTERYKVVCDKTSTITSEELSAWVEVYCNSYCDHTDMHQEFADKLHTTRGYAKQLAHTIAWRLCEGLENLGHHKRGGV